MQIKKKEIGKIFEKLQLDVRSTKHRYGVYFSREKDIESPLFTWQGEHSRKGIRQNQKPTEAHTKGFQKPYRLSTLTEGIRNDTERKGSNVGQTHLVTFSDLGAGNARPYP